MKIEDVKDYGTITITNSHSDNEIAMFAEKNKNLENLLNFCEKNNIYTSACCAGHYFQNLDEYVQYLQSKPFNKKCKEDLKHENCHKTFPMFKPPYLSIVILDDYLYLVDALCTLAEKENWKYGLNKIFNDKINKETFSCNLSLKNLDITYDMFKDFTDNFFVLLLNFIKNMKKNVVQNNENFKFYLENSKNFSRFQLNIADGVIKNCYTDYSKISLFSNLKKIDNKKLNITKYI